MTRYARETRDDLEFVFRRAGVVEPEDTVAKLVPCVIRNESIFSRENERGGIQSSTFSTRLQDVDIAAATKAFNERLQERVVERLAAFPPDDHEVLSILDINEAEYYLTQKKNKVIIVEVSRQPFALKASASNKSAPFCHKMLNGILAWRCKGHWIMLPFMVHLTGALEQQVRLHREWAEAAYSRMHIVPAVSIGDRAYDSSGFRGKQIKFRARFMHRVRTGEESNRWFVLEDGRKLRISELCEQIALESLPVYADRMPKSRERFAYKVKNFKGRFQGDPTTVQLTLKVGITPNGGTRKQPKWNWNPDTSMALASDLFDLGAETLADLYLRRHRIEVFFQHFTNDRESLRPKTIQAFLLGYLTKVAVITGGQLARLETLLEALQSGRLERAPKSWTVKRAIRDVVDAMAAMDPAPPPPD